MTYNHMDQIEKDVHDTLLTENTIGVCNDWGRSHKSSLIGANPMTKMILYKSTSQNECTHSYGVMYAFIILLEKMSKILYIMPEITILKL